MFIENITRIEKKMRPLVSKLLPPALVSFIYSNGRKYAINQLVNAKFNAVHLSESANVKLWDISFNCGLFNAAGMFKYGEGYNVSAKIGAGAYLAGTTTMLPRSGNTKSLIKHPFMPYPFSKSSSNWMGLPNPGHSVVAKTLSELQKMPNCPIGASVAENPEVIDNIERMDGIVDGIKMYEKANVDFIELNFSCPNVPHQTANNIKCNGLDKSMVDNLTYIAEKYINHKNKNLPIIVKFSNDIDSVQLLQVIDLLIDLRYDGINIGNTSTDYATYAQKIIGSDARLYKYFTEKIGGGLSGEILKERSLAICSIAINYLKNKQLQKEFHCIRTGGVSTPEDISQSKNAGILMNEWFAGFFEQFSNYGFQTYSYLFGK
ncbi:MAG: hypothetical protein LBO69_03210 [Ignavibacteria bacterium]|jgi:dihydroorotate dehydrogenase|nr:hypothetical protein [Ignavibacteria bacterium]